MDLILIGLVVLIIILVLAVIGFVIVTYNSLIGLRNRIENAMAQIDVQLKKRYDLIPNLVETVKGYAKHEKTTFENVTRARAATASATTTAEKAEAANMLTQTLKSLFAVVENYPELKANQNFLNLQSQLTEIEDKIAFARQFYNDTVLKYHNRIQMFPANLIAGMFNFKERDFFKTATEQKEAPKVSF
ncbi:MAG: LemA family protein [Candidatus Diapherotrites archaeon]